jgi:spermidine synthase
MRKAFLSLFCCMAGVLLFYGVAMSEDEKVLYEGDSLYHHIRVSEAEGYRYLSFNRTRGSQSMVSVKEPFELQFAYTRAAFFAPAFLEKKPEKILLIGLGAGSIPKVMAKYYPDAKIDIVEIDEDVLKVAKKYFFFEQTQNMNITIMDGRSFLRRSGEKYDLIFLDAYDDLSIPFHLTTKEFFEIVKERLSPNGIVASNVWGPRNDQFYLSEAKTYQSVFPHVYMIDAIPSNNYIMIAHSYNKVFTKIILKERIPALQIQFGFNFPLMTFAETFEDLTGHPFDAKILLDDFAPVEVLRSRKATSK